MAWVGRVRAEREKTCVHSPLGTAIGLARHLILWVAAVPRVVNLSVRVVKLSRERPVSSAPGPAGDRTHENCYGDH